MDARSGESQPTWQRQSTNVADKARSYPARPLNREETSSNHALGVNPGIALGVTLVEVLEQR